MIVDELRSLIEDLDGDTEVRIAEYGYRSSGYYYVDEADIYLDMRKSDDWGNRKDPLGKVLVITMGGTADNRYPPRPADEYTECDECGELFDADDEGDEGICGECWENREEDEDGEV